MQAWLLKNPRFIFHHPPVHCSWMNQVEQWLVFSNVNVSQLQILLINKRFHNGC
ncbi:MAG: hypothetical protein RMZ43_014545 [Nostoc sp. CmiVER01]|uniref:hypothetical protein n=1 Tax=Nostoc sp. CmiVER01 TaxID=3075384 RepID=UPI003D160AFF